MHTLEGIMITTANRNLIRDTKLVIPKDIELMLALHKGRMFVAEYRNANMVGWFTSSAPSLYHYYNFDTKKALTQFVPLTSR